MFKRNYINISVSAAALMVMSSAANAQDPVASEASVTVQNTFQFAETVGISFGTLRIAHDGANVATLVVAPDNTTTATANAGSSFNVLAAASAAEFAITGAAPFSDISVTIPAAAVPLTISTAPPSNAELSMDSFLFVDATAPSSTPLATDGTQTVTTDAAGDANILVGATLNTGGTGTSYVDGDYTGNMVVTVSY